MTPSLTDIAFPGLQGIYSTYEVVCYLRIRPNTLNKLVLNKTTFELTPTPVHILCKIRFAEPLPLATTASPPGMDVRCWYGNFSKGLVSTNVVFSDSIGISGGVRRQLLLQKTKYFGNMTHSIFQLFGDVYPFNGTW